ncbi:hypothetical protein O3W44_00200 [Pantoea sp. LMR881]|uniref:transcriptional antitermination N peptide n=1 Tax=Pantoea sp. LMR881 TaxID=3014336 RepID=UPI0022AEEBE5|nr:hypothetical protein [Pantoea sp. LMR881]MCZ4057825.1 hypothetical protein [Pantoea sp. LMR881]
MTRRTAFAGSSAGRRRERRAHLQSDVSNSSEALHRPTPSRVVLQCKRKPVDVVSKAVDTDTEYHKQILAGAEKYVSPSKSVFNSKPKSEYGFMAVGRQKMKGKSIPLI